MKLTNAEVYNSREPFMELMKEKLPVLVSYKLAKLASSVEAHYKVVDQIKNQLVLTYGEIDESNPSNKIVNPGMENFPKFMEEYAALMAEEIELDIDVVELPLKAASACSSCHQIMEKDFEVQPYILVALDKFITIAELGLVRS